MQKQAAYDYLKDLESTLIRKLPIPETMRSRVRAVVEANKAGGGKPHKRQPEDAFLYEFAVPILFEHLQTSGSMTRREAGEALLSEYFRNMDGMSMASPARKERHPFNKMLGASPAEIAAQWKGEANGPALKQSCPDFAIRTPFPHKIVFEGKYFQSGSRDRADAELVNCVYQAFFYRALPKSEGNWDYDYACLMAYDASPDGALYDAWNELRPEVKRGFWEGANVYVMIIRGVDVGSGT